MNGSVGAALALTAAAGASTLVGGALGILVKKPGPRLMTATLGFAAGVLAYISFVNLLGNAIDTLGFLKGNAAFFAGILGMFLVDSLTPHTYGAEHRRDGHGEENARLLRTGVFVSAGLAIHNFPEGLATFAGTLQDTKVGLAIAAAIAVHNIPEGLAVSAPIYAATGSRRRAFLYAAASGAAEPAGALAAAVLLYPFLTSALLGWIIGAIGGLMVYVAFDELAPASREYGHEHVSIMSAVAGMAVMAGSLWMLEALE
jgi:ZIP family zinc transporter